MRYCRVDENGASDPVGTAMILLLAETDDAVFGPMGLYSSPYAEEENEVTVDATANCTNLRRLVWIVGFTCLCRWRVDTLLYILSNSEHVRYEPEHMTQHSSSTQSFVDALEATSTLMGHILRFLTENHGDEKPSI